MPRTITFLAAVVVTLWSVVCALMADAWDTPLERVEFEGADQQLNDGLYLGRQRSIQSIHVGPVTDCYERVVDYVFKIVLRGRSSYDEALLVLPRASEELLRT